MCVRLGGCAGSVEVCCHCLGAALAKCCVLCALMLRDVAGYVCCAAENQLGPEGGAAVAEAMNSCTQLASLDLRGMHCPCVRCDV